MATATRARNRVGRLLRWKLKPAVVVVRDAQPQRAPRRVRSARRSAVIAVGVAFLVFIAIQVVLSGSSAVTHLVADPVYADKERRLRRLEQAAPPGTPRVLLLGSSRTGFAYSAGRTQRAAEEAGTPAVAFNFGIPGAGPVAHRLNLPRLLADGHRPDLLILEVLPPLLADLPGGPREGPIMSGDTLTHDELAVLDKYAMPTERYRKQWRQATFLPISAHRFKLLSRLWPNLVHWQLRADWGRTQDPNGWNPAFQQVVTAEERARGVESTLREYRDVVKHDLPAGPAVEALRDTLSLCRERGIPVALVILPETTAFRAIYPPGAEEKITRFLAGLQAEFGCSLTDARQWLPDDAFLDGHHLLHDGAMAFTDRLTTETILPFLRQRSAGKTSP